MYMLRILLIIVMIVQLMDRIECDDKNWFEGLIPGLSKKKEEPKKSESWSIFASKEKEKPKESSGWSLSNVFSSNEKPKPKPESKNWFSSSEKKEDKNSKSTNWLPNFKILSSLISSKELTDTSTVDLTSKNASRTNLSNWELINLNITNFNFSFGNVSNWELPKLPKLNTTSLLNLNNSRDWLINLKAKYYGNLLGNNQTTNTESIIKVYKINDTSTVTPTIDKHLITTTDSSSLRNESSNSSNYNMNFTIFKDRLYKVYDNLAFCEHPCNDKKVKKNLNIINITINGCGPSYFSPNQLAMIPYGEFFKGCCDLHDTKYADCGFKKQEADHSFLNCMLNLINKTSEQEPNSWPRIQRTFGYALFGLVDLFGCKAWAIAQKEVCNCL